MSEDNATTSANASVDTTMRLNALRAADSVSGSTIKRASEPDMDGDTEHQRHVRPRYSDDATSLSTHTVASVSSASANNSHSSNGGDNNNDDVSSFSSSASSSSGHCAGGITVASSPPRLYRHALESIFSFFDVNEVVAALCVCRDWRAAVTSMAYLQFVIKNVTSLSRLSVSDLSRHIVKIDKCDNMDLDAVAISTNFPRLHTLMCILHAEVSVTCFPSTLTNLTVFLDEIEDEQSDNEEHEDEKSADGETSNDVPSSAWQRSVDAIGHLQMLKVCCIDMPCLPMEFSFGCLSSCCGLRSLEIKWNDDDELTKPQLDELRSMPHLDVLELQRVSPANLSYLLRPPHQLQWRKFQFTEDSDELEQMRDADTTLMASLPLVYFNYTLCGSNVEFLHRLPNLTVLDICCFHSTIGDHPDVTTAALSSCRLLRRLRISGHSCLTDVHLKTLLPCLSYLRSLSLEGAVLSSLSFLAQAPLTEQLTALSISGEEFEDPNYPESTPLLSSELQYVFELRHLVFLRLLPYCFSSLMESEFSFDHFQVPSQRMPQLQTFSMSPHTSWPLPQALHDAEDRCEYIT